MTDALFAAYCLTGTLAFIALTLACLKYFGKGWLWVALLLAVAVPVGAQTCPGFPVRGVQIIDALYNPAQAQGDDDQRRALTRSILEQLVYEQPADGWTWKSADPGRPPSKDSLSRLVAGRLCNWDWQNGGTRQRSVQAGDHGEDITGQNPIPLAGVNHLSDGPPPVTPPPPGPNPPPLPPPVSTDLSPVYQRIDWLSASFDRAFADLVNRDNAKTAQITALDDRVRKMDEDPSWLRKVFTNPTVLASIAGAFTTWIAAR